MPPAAELLLLTPKHQATKFFIKDMPNANVNTEEHNQARDQQIHCLSSSLWSEGPGIMSYLCEQLRPAYYLQECLGWGLRVLVLGGMALEYLAI